MKLNCLDWPLLMRYFSGRSGEAGSFIILFFYLSIFASLELWWYYTAQLLRPGHLGTPNT